MTKEKINLSRTSIFELANLKYLMEISSPVKYDLVKKELFKKMLKMNIINFDNIHSINNLDKFFKERMNKETYQLFKIYFSFNHIKHDYKKNKKVFSKLYEEYMGVNSFNKIENFLPKLIDTRDSKYLSKFILSI